MTEEGKQGKYFLKIKTELKRDKTLYDSSLSVYFPLDIAQIFMAINHFGTGHFIKT